jgi:hypothetical protein
LARNLASHAVPKFGALWGLTPKYYFVSMRENRYWCGNTDKTRRKFSNQFSILKKSSLLQVNADILKSVDIGKPVDCKFGVTENHSAVNYFY